MLRIDYWCGWLHACYRHLYTLQRKWHVWDVSHRCGLEEANLNSRRRWRFKSVGSQEIWNGRIYKKSKSPYHQYHSIYQYHQYKKQNSMLKIRHAALYMVAHTCWSLICIHWGHIQYIWWCVFLNKVVFNQTHRKSEARYFYSNKSVLGRWGVGRGPTDSAQWDLSSCRVCVCVCVCVCRQWTAVCNWSGERRWCQQLLADSWEAQPSMSARDGHQVWSGHPHHTHEDWPKPPHTPLQLTPV